MAYLNLEMTFEYSKALSVWADFPRMLLELTVPPTARPESTRP